MEGVGERLDELEEGVKWGFSQESLCSIWGKGPLLPPNAYEPYLVWPIWELLVWEDSCEIGMGNNVAN